MRTPLCLVLALGAAAPAAAALPPHYQRAAELQAVVAAPGVAAAFGIEAPIQRVEYVKPDLYRVSAGRCHLDVAIVDLPTPKDVSGGRRFAARPGKKVCGP